MTVTTRQERLDALADLHSEWVGENLAKASRAFDPSGRKKGSDYNQHHVDLDADGDAQDEFSKAGMALFEPRASRGGGERGVSVDVLTRDRMLRLSGVELRAPRDGDGDGFYSPRKGMPDRTPLPVAAAGKASHVVGVGGVGGKNDNGQPARTGVLGSALERLEGLRGKLGDNDRAELDRAMAQLRGLESSDVNDDDLIVDEPDVDDNDDDTSSDLVMDSASGELTFTPYADGDIDVDFDDSNGIRFTPQTTREVIAAVTDFNARPVYPGPPNPPAPPASVTTREQYVQWYNQWSADWDATDAGRVYGSHVEMTTSDGEWKVRRYGSGVLIIGEPDAVDAEEPGTLQLDDPTEGAAFVDMLRSALASSTGTASSRSDPSKHRDRALRVLGLELRATTQPQPSYAQPPMPMMTDPDEPLTPAEAARDYGDELDRVELDDGTAVVARSQGVLSIQTAIVGPDDAALIHAAPSPDEAQGWADYIEDGLDLDEGEVTEQDGLQVTRTADGLLLRWPEGDEHADAEDLDGVDLSDDDVATFTQALRDMAQVTQDNDPGDETAEAGTDPAAMMRHRTLELLGVELRAVDPKHPHYGKGVAGGKGGQFRPISAQIMDALTGAGESGGDPLAKFSQPQLKKAAEQLGLNPPKGMRLVPLKGLLMAHGRGEHVAAPDVPKTVATKAAPKAKPDVSIEIAAILKQIPDDGSGTRRFAEQIVNGTASQGGVRITKPAAKAKLLRLTARTDRKVADDNHRAVPTPKSRDELKRANLNAEKMEAIADLLSPPRGSRPSAKPDVPTPGDHPDLPAVPSPDGKPRPQGMTTSPAALSASMTPRQREIDIAIREAYGKLRGRTDLPTNGVMVGNPGMGMPMTDLRQAWREGGKVFLADIRDELGEKYGRHEIDEVLKRLIEDPDFHILPMHAQQILMPRDRDSQLHMGGGTVDYIDIEHPQFSRPSQFGALAMADELDARRAGKPRDRMMSQLSDAELQAEIDKRVANDPVVARDMANRKKIEAAVPSAAKKAAPKRPAAPRAPKAEPAKLSADFAAAVERPMPSDRDRLKADLTGLTGAQLADLAIAHGAKLPAGTKQKKVDWLVEHKIGNILNSESIRHGGWDSGNLITGKQEPKNARLAEINAEMKAADLRGDREAYGRLHQERVNLQQLGMTPKDAKALAGPRGDAPSPPRQSEIDKIDRELDQIDVRLNAEDNRAPVRRQLQAMKQALLAEKAKALAGPKSDGPPVQPLQAKPQTVAQRPSGSDRLPGSLTALIAELKSLPATADGERQAKDSISHLSVPQLKALRGQIDTAAKDGKTKQQIIDEIAEGTVGFRARAVVMGSIWAEGGLGHTQGSPLGTSVHRQGELGGTFLDAPKRKKRSVPKA